MASEKVIGEHGEYRNGYRDVCNAIKGPMKSEEKEGKRLFSKDVVSPVLIAQQVRGVTMDVCTS
jgi:hypothetical protein